METKNNSDMQAFNASLVSARRVAGENNIILGFNRPVVFENVPTEITVVASDGTVYYSGSGKSRDSLTDNGPGSVVLCLADAVDDIDFSKPAIVLIPEDCKQIRSASGGRVIATAMFIDGWQE